jgi:uncharacterized protein (UPF0147 family)
MSHWYLVAIGIPPLRQAQGRDFRKTMAPILELIKKNAVPVNVMRSAAKGALPIPAEEMLEVLVYLAQNPLFGQDARMTLARWDAQSAMDVLRRMTASPDVLLYFWSEENRRPGLMPTLIENEAIPEELLMELAGSGSREMVAILLNSPRARENPGVVEALSGNEYVTPAELKALQGGKGGPDAAVSSAPAAEEVPQQAEQEAALEEFEVLPETAAALQAFVEENAAEIAAAENKPFELVKEEEESGAETAPAAAAEETERSEAAAEGAAQAAAAATSFAQQDELEAAEEKRLTVLQKVGKLNVGQRIKLGFVGGKEERALLIRDTARLVQNAVLNSPKLSDPEVETFAAAKNLQENVFREIARQRRFLKLYPVVRNLVNNPRCPLDISLTLIKTLLIYDLKSLRHNKNVPDTIRKVAAKLYTEKASRGGAKKE